MSLITSLGLRASSREVSGQDHQGRARQFKETAETTWGHDGRDSFAEGLGRALFQVLGTQQVPALPELTFWWRKAGNFYKQMHKQMNGTHAAFVRGRQRKQGSSIV